MILCITGMPGAGKTTAAKALEGLGFELVSLGDVVREEASKRGLEPTDTNLGLVMLKLREESGPGAVAQLALPKILSTSKKCVVVDGIRSIEEVKVFQKIAKAKLVAVHASPETRFRYLKARGRKDAPSSWEFFQARDQRELEVGVGRAIALADEVISNNEISIDELQRRIVELAKRWL